MNVRRLGAGDALLWCSGVERLIPSEDRDDELISSAEAETALADERCYMIVAEVDGTVEGLLSAYRFPDLEAGGQLLYLYDIEVEISKRRMGIGRLLIEVLLTCCDEDDVDSIWAGTEVTNEPARVLFARTGASLEGESYAEYEWLLE